MKSYGEAWADAYDAAVDAGCGDGEASLRADDRACEHMGDAVDAAEYQMELHR